MNSDTILEMEGISKVFAGVEALKNVSFRLRRGEIHALVGENGAGKSTLMKILIGIYRPEKGTIRFKGEQVEFKDTSEALSSGISMIHQEISLVQQMDVSENVWLGREKRFLKMGLIDVKRRYQETENLMRTLKIEGISPRALVKDLSVAQMQLVELARAVSYNSDIIIMDEPTSALTTREIEILYQIVRDLSAKGVAIVFISHKLDEIFKICSRITVLRDGAYIDTIDSDDVDERTLMNMIAGRQLSDMYVRTPRQIGDVRIEVRDLTQAGKFNNINFQVRAGEIVGFYGLMGAGRTEIMRSIFGLDDYAWGEVLIDGKKVEIKNPSKAVQNNIGMLTEDRLRLGVIYTMSIMGNATIAAFQKLCNRLGMFTPRKEKNKFLSKSDDLRIKYASENDLIGSLSGGNQQKVLLERWMLTNPRILIADEPTRGIDVGAKREIYELIDEMARQGMAVLLVSSELPEVMGMADRIIVIRDGEQVYECTHDEADQIELVSYAFGKQGAGEAKHQSSTDMERTA